jgi:hypothetical protein
VHHPVDGPRGGEVSRPLLPGGLVGVAGRVEQLREVLAGDPQLPGWRLPGQLQQDRLVPADRLGTELGRPASPPQRRAPG